MISSKTFSKKLYNYAKNIQRLDVYCSIGDLILLPIISSLKKELKIKYIMPQQSNEKLKRLIESSKLSAYTIFEYVFNEDRAEEYRFGAKLFYIIAENGEKIYFCNKYRR